METIKIGLLDLEVFVAVAKHRSVSHAARVLGVSKSYVSKRMTELEKQLGEELFVRTTRSFWLTPIGEKLKDRFEQPITELSQSARNIAKGSIIDPREKAIISATYDVCLFLLSSPLQRVLKVHQCIVDIVADDNPIDFFQGDFTAAIRVNRIVDDRLIAKFLGEMTVVWVCHSRLADNLETLPIALPSAAILKLMGGDQTRLNEIGDRIVLSTNTPLQLREFVRLGLGCAPLPMFLAADLMRTGEIQLIEQLPSFKSILLRIFKKEIPAPQGSCIYK